MDLFKNSYFVCFTATDKKCQKIQMELVSQSLTGKYLKIQLVHIWFADAGINVQAFHGFYSYSF